jgi:hypothetical protein
MKLIPIPESTAIQHPSFYISIANTFASSLQRVTLCFLLSDGPQIISSLDEGAGWLPTRKIVLYLKILAQCTNLEHLLIDQNMFITLTDVIDTIIQRCGPKLKRITIKQSSCFQ